MTGRGLKQFAVRSTAAAVSCGAVVLAVPSATGAALPKPGAFNGSIAAPYAFGKPYKSQGFSFIASGRRRAIIKIPYLRCSVVANDVNSGRFLGVRRMEAKVSTKGNVYGKSSYNDTRRGFSYTQTVKGTFTSRTRAKGTASVTYRTLPSPVPPVTCKIGGKWSATRAKNQ